jgi:uncharacterized metal-binding protein YceD (DUF177 family)
MSPIRLIHLLKDCKMPNEQRKAPNPLSVPTNSVGRGLALVLPNTPKEVATSNGLVQDLKTAQLETLNTDWLSAFLNEHNLVENHTPQGVLALTHEAGLYRVKADLKFSPQLECARCLELFRLSLQTQTQAVFTDHNRCTDKASHSSKARSRNSADDWASEDGIGLSVDDLEIYEFSGPNIALDEFLLDTMQVEIPDFPLCSETCPGLCAECGNINAPQHVCKRPRS